MSGKTYAVLGGGGSFGIHTALYLLENAEPEKVIGIGRNPLRAQPFHSALKRTLDMSTMRGTSLMSWTCFLSCWTGSARVSLSTSRRKGRERCHGPTHGAFSKLTRWLLRDSQRN